ncbi:MAG: hypothetical protein PHY72_03610 [Candidatus Pacebacteria bacterium]|nr:hypothetical protein [Candidatus Paceibacterota bacterium]
MSWLRSIRDTFKKKKQNFLFNVGNEERERNAIFRFILSPIFLQNLYTSGSFWYWVGVNIPLDIFGSGVNGDVDFLISFSKLPSICREERLYQVAEIKTCKVNKRGRVGATHSGDKKINKTVKQLEKLRSFGSGRVSLFEIFILEKYFSLLDNNLIKIIQPYVVKKGKKVCNNGFSYYPFALEPFSGKSSERESGWLHELLPVCSFGGKEDVGLFKIFTENLETFFEENKKDMEALFPIVTCCEKCRKLQIINPHSLEDDFKCKFCGYLLFRNF